MVISDDQLYRLLLENEYLSEEQLISAIESSKQENIGFYDSLVEKDLVSDENLGKIIADYLKLPFINLSKVTISEDVIKIIPESFARKQKIIVFSHTSEGIKVATANPQNRLAAFFIEKKAGQ